MPWEEVAVTTGQDTALCGLSACSSSRRAAGAEVRTEVRRCPSLVVSVHQHAGVGCAPPGPPISPVRSLRPERGEADLRGAEQGEGRAGQGCPSDFVPQVVMIQISGEG